MSPLKNVFDTVDNAVERETYVVERVMLTGRTEMTRILINRARLR